MHVVLPVEVEKHVTEFNSQDKAIFLSKLLMYACVLSCFRYFTTTSMGFSRQEYWPGLPFPSPGDCSHPGIKLTSPALAGSFFITEPSRKPYVQKYSSLQKFL